MAKNNFKSLKLKINSRPNGVRKVIVTVILVKKGRSEARALIYYLYALYLSRVHLGVFIRVVEGGGKRKGVGGVRPQGKPGAVLVRGY